MKRTITFIDAQKRLVVVNIEIDDKQGPKRLYDTLEVVNEYKTASFCGNVGGNAGQCNDEIEPRTSGQRQLLDLWKQWHLNDMQAATKPQQEFIDSPEYSQLVEDVKARINQGIADKKEYVSFPYKHMDAVMNVFEYIPWGTEGYRYKNLLDDGYEMRRLLLDLNNLSPDRGYKYGTAWLLKPLPEDFEEDLDCLIEAIEEENEEYAEQLDRGFDMGEKDFVPTQEHIETIMERMDYDETEAQMFIALGMHLNVTVGELADDIELDAAEFTASAMGMDFYIGECDDLEQLANEIVHNDPEYEYFWREAVAAEKTTDSLQDWLDEVVRYDGYESVLGHYDGQSSEYKVVNKYYSIVRSN